MQLARGLRPMDTLRYGLADATMPAQTLAACWGKERFGRIQRRINPAGLECLLKDKSVFYPYCMGLGLPVPELYGIFDVLGSWAVGGHLLESDQEWHTFLQNTLPSRFVMKPAWGIYGDGFRPLTREGDRFRESNGTLIDGTELVRSLRNDPSYRRWVIQELLCNHPTLESLTGVASLQTVRITTFVGADRVARAYAPWLKIIGGTALTDNLHGGISGNFLVAVDLSSGLLHAGRRFDTDGTGMSRVGTHPKTGVAFEGTRLPFWNEALALVSRAARLFLPVRAIGWDVALTPRGPVLVEGNIWWDPPNMLASSPPVDKHEEGAMGQLVSMIVQEASRPPRPGRGYRADRA